MESSGKQSLKMKEIFQKGKILKRNNSLFILSFFFFFMLKKKEIMVCCTLFYQAFSVAHPVDYQNNYFQDKTEALFTKRQYGG